MEDSSREVVYPNLEQLIDINRRMINEFGGLFVKPDNIINRSAIDYVLEAIEATVFGVEMYPSMKEKACAITYHIITRHVFNDGNKRTAIAAGLEFLRSNNVSLFIDDSVVDLSVKIADGKADDEILLAWLHEHQ